VRDSTRRQGLSLEFDIVVGPGCFDKVLREEEKFSLMLRIADLIADSGNTIPNEDD
jgi:hypothetical protein